MTMHILAFPISKISFHNVYPPNKMTVALGSVLSHYVKLLEYADSNGVKADTQASTAASKDVHVSYLDTLGEALTGKLFIYNVLKGGTNDVFILLSHRLQE